jgi:rieske iron-sulfur protein
MVEGKRGSELSARVTCGCAATPRRRFLQAALAAGLSLGLGRAGNADEDEKPGADERPQPGDLFVQAEGDRAAAIVSPADLPLGGPPLLAWPMDPATRVVRNGSRLNLVLLLRLDPASLDAETRAHAADGVLAYSAICAHAGCTVTGWIVDDGRQVLKCFCHNSEYDPRQNAKVVSGPAQRHLAALPVKLGGGELLAAGTFIGKVVPQLQG